MWHDFLPDPWNVGRYFSFSNVLPFQRYWARALYTRIIMHTLFIPFVLHQAHITISREDNLSSTRISEILSSTIPLFSDIGARENRFTYYKWADFSFAISMYLLLLLPYSVSISFPFFPSYITLFDLNDCPIVWIASLSITVEIPRILLHHHTLSFWQTFKTYSCVFFFNFIYLLLMCELWIYYRNWIKK